MQARGILQRLAKDNPQVYEPGLARTLYNIGILYAVQDRYEEATLYMEEARNIYQRLAENYPTAFQKYFEKVEHVIQLLQEAQNGTKD